MKKTLKPVDLRILFAIAVIFAYCTRDSYLPEKKAKKTYYFQVEAEDLDSTITTQSPVWGKY